MDGALRIVHRRARARSTAPSGRRARIRTGDYRIQFYLEGDTVVIEKVGKRDGFYEE